MKLLVCLPWFALSALAADPQISAELELRSANLGDPVGLTITILHDGTWQFPSRALPEELEDGRVLNQFWRKLEPTEAQPDLHGAELTARLAWYRLGEQKLPAITFHGEDAGGELHPFTTPELTIDIQPMLDEKDAEAAPSKGQVDMDVPSFWPWAAGGAALLLLLAWLGYRYGLRRGKQPAYKPVVPALPPHLEALEKLNALTSGGLLKEGRTKEFYVEICLIVRHFYARLWPIHAEEMTTFELEDWFEGQGDLPPGFVDLNRRFHDACDRVKFAKHDPVGAETKEIVNCAYLIVDLFKPQAEVPSVAVG